MTEPSDDRPSSSESFWHRRRPGIRYISSAVAIVGGAVLAFRFAGEGEASGWMMPVALGLIALGLGSIPVNRWMDKRGL